MNPSSTAVIHLSRDVEAIQIPSGQKTLLPAQAPVIITQALGGTYTVVIEGKPGLYRILSQDADALGKTSEAPAPSPGASGSNGALTEDQVWTQLKTCYDPEIPVNIVDLGLVYSLEIKPEAQGAGKRVEVKMTLTAPGCGMGPSIAADAQSKIMTLPGVAEAAVDLVWDPPWTPDRISPAGKIKLGMA